MHFLRLDGVAVAAAAVAAEEAVAEAEEGATSETDTAGDSKVAAGSISEDAGRLSTLSDLLEVAMMYNKSKKERENNSQYSRKNTDDVERFYPDHAKIWNDSSSDWREV